MKGLTLSAFVFITKQIGLAQILQVLQFHERQASFVSTDPNAIKRPEQDSRDELSSCNDVAQDSKSALCQPHQYVEASELGQSALSLPIEGDLYPEFPLVGSINGLVDCLTLRLGDSLGEERLKSLLPDFSWGRRSPPFFIITVT